MVKIKLFGGLNKRLTLPVLSVAFGVGLALFSSSCQKTDIPVPANIEEFERYQPALDSDSSDSAFKPPKDVIG